MPDSRQHRGPHPEDHKLFAPAQVALLRQAVLDLSLLLSKGYPRDSALKLVGDHFALNKRQRDAMGRATCSEQEREVRLAKLTGTPRSAILCIDGYNVLTTIESALGGALVLLCRDGCYRDIAALKGTWRRVQETLPALSLMARHIREAGFAKCLFLLDKPVSNSGRLRKLILDFADEQKLDWSADLDSSVDRTLIRSGGLIASSDSMVIDQSQRWYNLAGHIIESYISEAWCVELA